MSKLLLIEDDEQEFEEYFTSYKKLGYDVVPKSYNDLYKLKNEIEFYNYVKNKIIKEDIDCISMDLNFIHFSNLNRNSIDITNEQTGIHFIKRLAKDNILKVRTLPIIILSRFSEDQIEDAHELESMVSLFIDKKTINQNTYMNEFPLHGYMTHIDYRLDLYMEFLIKYYHRINHISYNHAFDEYKKYQDMKNIRKEILTSISSNSSSMIRPYYQAIVDKNAKLIKYEVLANIGEERNSFYSYSKIAKFYGLLHDVTIEMIKQSFKEHSKNKSIGLSINLDYDDLINDNLEDFKHFGKERTQKKLDEMKLEDFKHTKFYEFITFLKKESDQYNISPNLITLEILEGAKHNTYISVAIRFLKEAGYKIAIDDFGIENSNFIRVKNQLNEKCSDFIEGSTKSNTCIDFIKIDAEFIKGIHKSNVSKSIVSAIVSFAQTNNIQTVVEHIDNKDDFDTCANLDIDLFQGYYFDKPTLLQEKNEDGLHPEQLPKH